MIFSEGEYVNDMLEGFLKFYDRGKLIAKIAIKHDIFDGVYTSYHDNGTVWSELLIRQGKRMEILSNYSSDGKSMPKGTLKNGSGTVIRYDEKGNQIAIDHYKNGVKITQP
jgi:antitoxin component YwqK of YwqJK toxin-antitoxin module